MGGDRKSLQVAVNDMQGSTIFEAGVLILLSFKGSEGISQTFSYSVSVLVPSNITFSFDKMLGQQVTVIISLDGEKKNFFRGICNALSEGTTDSTGNHYHANVVSPMWLLSRRVRSRVFHNQSVADIVKLKTLDEFFKSVNVDFKMPLSGQYPAHDFCTQYRESDFNFVSRLMEEEGIYYFWEHGEKKSSMVATDPTAGSHTDIDIEGDLVFGAGGSAGLAYVPNRVHQWEKTQQVRSSGYKLIDHHFAHQNPVSVSQQPLTSPEVMVGSISHKMKILGDDFSIIDYPGEYSHRFDDVNLSGGTSSNGVGKIDNDKDRAAKIRIEQHTASSLVINGSSTCAAFASGKTFKITGSKHADGKYLLVSVTHSMSQAGLRAGHGSSTHYENNFVAVPFDTTHPYRSPRRATRPYIAGSQTATVVGLDSDATQEILTDKYGRVKVKFHWNPDDKKGEDSSRWVRVGQMAAGNRWGASFWPRVGQEVIVTFLEGDPDQPIIVGSVYNAKQMPPYLGEGLDSKHTNNNHISGFKSNTTSGGDGYNELRFDDTKDKEQVFIHAARDYDLRVKNESRERIVGHRNVIVGGEKDGEKFGDLREKVLQDRHITIERNQIENVKGNIQLLVGGGEGENGTLELVTKKDLKELIEGDQHLHVKMGRNEKVDMNQSLTVGMNQDEKIGQNHALEAGMGIHIKAGMTLILEAGVQLSLKVGGNFIDIGPAGISITGTMVMINSGGAAGSGGGASPTAPADASEAAPTKPDDADYSVTGNKSSS